MKGSSAVRYIMGWRLDIRMVGVISTRKMYKEFKKIFSLHSKLYKSVGCLVSNVGSIDCSIESLSYNIVLCHPVMYLM